MSENIPNWAKVFANFQRITLWNFPGAKRVKLAWAINFHKIITLFIIVGMMFYFDNFSTQAWVYLSLHGIYGYCWLIKDFGFRDHRWETKVSLMGAINMYVTLIGWYWLIPYLFFATNASPSNFDLFFAIALHTLGVVTTVAADCQRHFTLKYKKGLMTDGLFRYTRNPNYLGEIMIYSSFAYLANHWLAWTIVAYVTVTTFFPNMFTKDASISRHPGWEEYKASSGLLVPWALINGRALGDLFAKDKLNAPE